MLIGSDLFIWNLVPRNWKLPLWERSGALVNSASYGHSVEHYAEIVRVWMMFGTVVGAVVA
jgi:hypothetical protein